MVIEYEKVVGKILASRKDKGKITQVYFVACGGSMSDLTPGRFFLQCESRTLRAASYSAKEFVLCPPKALDECSVVITLSDSGTTPETVEAAKFAREAGAVTVALTDHADCPLGKQAEYVFCYGDEPPYTYSVGPMAICLKFSEELLHQLEGYECHEEMKEAFVRLDRVIAKAREYAEPGAIRFAEETKDEKVIHVLASGSNYCVGYTTTTCILMECQWVHSNPIHAGEFFHGPFEIVDKEVPFLVLMGDGRERPMDERAVSFLRQYGKKVTVLDAKEFGINVLGDRVCEYLSPILFSGVVSVYSHKIARARQHSYKIRRYMWHVPY